MDIPFYCPECKNNLDTKNGSHFCGECSLEYPVVNGIPSFVKDDSFKNNHFLSEYFDDLIATEKRHFWHKTKRKLLYKYLQSNIPDLATKGFFELGCGSGYFLNYLMERGVRIQGGGDFWIDTVIQSTFVQVDEKGTEAAAITIFPIPVYESPYINCKRPFAFMIWEKESGAILFMGKVAQPVWENE